MSLEINGAGGPTAQGQAVSGNYYAALGVGAALGRVLIPDDGERPGEGAVAVLSYAFWQRRFGGDPGVVGQTVRLNGTPHIVGVSSRFFGTGSVCRRILRAVSMQKRDARLGASGCDPQFWLSSSDAHLAFRSQAEKSLDVCNNDTAGGLPAPSRSVAQFTGSARVEMRQGCLSCDAALRALAVAM